MKRKNLKISGLMLSSVIIIVSFVYAVNIQPAVIGDTDDFSSIFGIPLITDDSNGVTLYHNLKNIRVNTGETVFTKQSIGNVFTDERTNQTILHFQVWKESKNNNPEIWLSN